MQWYGSKGKVPGAGAAPGPRKGLDMCGAANPRTPAGPGDIGTILSEKLAFSIQVF
jgi:hypothetical protein